MTAAFGDITTRGLPTARRQRWRRDADELEAWRLGQTGYPIVDAGMRQLRAEGLDAQPRPADHGVVPTKHLAPRLATRRRHFFQWLVDGDVANNAGNWQWVAGTGQRHPAEPGASTRCARRNASTPTVTYVRRYVPELAAIDGAAVHRPWELDAARRARLDYPDPIVDHDDAIARFRALRAAR